MLRSTSTSKASQASQVAWLAAHAGALNRMSPYEARRQTVLHMRRIAESYRPDGERANGARSVVRDAGGSVSGSLAACRDRCDRSGGAPASGMDFCGTSRMRELCGAPLSTVNALSKRAPRPISFFAGGPDCAEDDAESSE